MRISCLRLFSLVISFALALGNAVYAAEAQLPDQRAKDVMPARAAVPKANIEIALVPASPRREAPKPASDGRTYDKEGRLIEVKTASIHSVYTYHKDGYSVFTENKERGNYSISEYKNGQLFSVTHSTGEFYRYEGRQLSLMITSTGTINEYKYLLNKDGSVYQMLTFTDGKYASTHTYLNKDTVMIDYANGTRQILTKGLLVYSKDRTGVEWSYTYTWDKKGQLDSRTATRLSDGFQQTLFYKTRVNNGNNAPVNFQKVLKAALESGLTKSLVTVKTSDKNTYTLKTGALLQMERENKSLHQFSDRTLTEAKFSNGVVIKLAADGHYVKTVSPATAPARR